MCKPPHDLKKLKLYDHKGYLAAYYPKHPRAWKGCGLIYLHRLIMENHLGRLLLPEEQVHHDDEDPKNNEISNLRLTSCAEHARLHYKKTHKVEAREPIVCVICKREFMPPNGRAKYCSIRCSHVGARKCNRPSAEELAKLVWEVPTRIIARDFGVSDVAVAKWCKGYGIKKPPRGWWRKHGH